MKAEKYTDFFEEAEKSMSKDSIRRAEREANKEKRGTAPDYFHTAAFFLSAPQNAMVPFDKLRAGSAHHQEPQ